MALEPKISIINNKSSIVIVDATGDYNGVTNPGGWDATGVNNPAHTTPSPVSAIQLDIYYPGSSTVDVNDFNLLTTSFFTTTDRAYDITSSVTLKDGVWKYEATFVVGVNSYLDVRYSLRVNELVCNIGKLALGNLDTNKFYEIKSMYDRMVQAFDCEEYVFAQELYEDIENLMTGCSPYSPNCNC
jgi:hypothetical protein